MGDKPIFRIVGGILLTACSLTKKTTLSSLISLFLPLLLTQSLQIKDLVPKAHSHRLLFGDDIREGINTSVTLVGIWLLRVFYFDQPVRFSICNFNFFKKTITHNSFFFFFNCYLAAPRPTSGHCRGDSLTHPMLITAFLPIRPEGHQEPRSEVGSLSPAERLVGFEPGTFRF